MSKYLVKEIIRAALSNEKEHLILEFRFKSNKKNELLFFFKPECFLLKNDQNTKAILEMVFSKFEQFNVDISGSLLLSGERLEELRIMDRHYGYINKLSRGASKLIGSKEKYEIHRSLNLHELDDSKFFGGHEFLEQFNEFDETSLDKLWLTKKSFKLRSGFYFQKYNVDDEELAIINGFHPSQLRHFTHPSHKIVLLLLHSNTDWKILKDDLVGDTFPEKANQKSIRWELYKNHNKYGIKDVSIANNFTHLSAGPFEALFEINNFLMDIKVIDFDLKLTNMFRLMIAAGLDKKDIENCLGNPTNKINNKEMDLFTYTENKNSKEAINDYINYFKREGHKVW